MGEALLDKKDLLQRWEFCKDVPIEVLAKAEIGSLKLDLGLFCR
jgi:hypothetical protein